MLWRYICIFSLLRMVVVGIYHLYNSEVSNDSDNRDCLYSFTVNHDINEWQLVRYCIGHNIDDSDNEEERCDDNATHTFEQLKSKNMTSYDLYRWRAPIDTIHDYQKYLTNDDQTLSTHLYCNCSGE